MVKKIFLRLGTLFICFSMLQADIVEAKFDVSYGLLGKIGTADAVLKKQNNMYEIDIRLHATGLAKLLSRGRKEQHISKGHLENGLMVSDIYRVIKSYGKVRTHKVYTIEHKTKQVRKIFKKYKNGKLVQKEDTVLDFYSKNDLLTLYFNLDALIADKSKAKSYVFYAIGAEKQKGKVSVVVPKKEQLSKYKKIVGNKASWYATAVIHQKIFSSKEGRLVLAVDKDGITNKAVLKDVIFFGDIRAKRIK